MRITIFKFHAFTDDFAVSKTGRFVEGHSFFLDFTRRLTLKKWPTKWLGFHAGLLVPVIHEGQKEGGYIIGVGRMDPYFKVLIALWNERFPSSRPAPQTEAGGLVVVADFANNFPEDC